MTLTGSGTDRDGKITAFEFVFGDGGVEKVDKDVGGAGSHSLTHSYTRPGTYWASLRVQDNRGDWSTTPENCKQKIEVTGVILAAAAPPVQPKTGAETWILASLLGAGPLGWWIRKIANIK